MAVCISTSNDELSQVSASLSQGIVQAAEPRLCLSQIFLGIGVDADHALSSWWLLDYLSHFVFSDEIKRINQSALKNDSTVVEMDEEAFSQW